MMAQVRDQILLLKETLQVQSDDDILGALVFKGENDADQAVTYGKIRSRELQMYQTEQRMVN